MYFFWEIYPRRVCFCEFSKCWCNLIVRVVLKWYICRMKHSKGGSWYYSDSRWCTYININSDVKNLNTSYYRYSVNLVIIIPRAASLTIASGRWSFEKTISFSLNFIFLILYIYIYSYIRFAYNKKIVIALLFIDRINLKIPIL